MTEPSGLRLVALKCEKCGSLLDADQNDVVYYCNNCDTGYELINEKDELVPAEVDFALPANVMDAEVIYYPFWVFDADITISSRDVSGSSGIIGELFKKNQGDGGTAGHVKKFYVPAFDTSLENIKKLGLGFTQHQPDYETVTKDKVRGCIYSSKDAEKIAEFIFLSLEAEKPDKLSSISYDLGLSSSKIVGMPFYRTEGTGLVDGILGIKLKSL